MKKDKYRNFSELKANRPNAFRINKLKGNDKFLVFTPHGGGIEPGTTEICEWFGRAAFSYYAFTGVGKNCKELHVTSTHFDEPKLIKMLTDHQYAVSFHGMTDYMKQKYGADIFLGGLNYDLQRRLKENLRNDYTVATSMDYPNSPLAASNPRNVTNRCHSNAGVQIELSESLRRSFFKDNFKLKKGRKRITKRLIDFCSIVKSTLDNY